MSLLWRAPRKSGEAKRRGTALGQEATVSDASQLKQQMDAGRKEKGGEGGKGKGMEHCRVDINLHQLVRWWASMSKGRKRHG